MARPPTHPARGWLRSGGAILITFAVAGCSTTGEGSPSMEPSTTSPAPSIAAPEERLAAALAPLRNANEFETSVSVDGTLAVSSIGRSVGGATELSVTSSGKTADYVRIPPNAWARESGGAWVLVTVDEAPDDPVAVLAAPTALAPDGSDPTKLLATYPAAALGLEGDPVSVTITLGAQVTFRYETDAGGHATVSQTVIRAATNLDPITAPA